MISLTSIQFHITVPNSVKRDKEKAVEALVIGSIQGFSALKLIEPYNIDVEYDDDDGENTYYIVILSPKSL